MPDWWLDERAHAGAEHLDPGYVAAYERKAGYDPVPDVEVLERHGLNSESTVVDLGCGTSTAKTRRHHGATAKVKTPVLLEKTAKG